MRLRSLLLSKLFWLLLIFSILVIIRLATGYFSNAPYSAGWKIQLLLNCYQKSASDIHYEIVGEPDYELIGTNANDWDVSVKIKNNKLVAIVYGNPSNETNTINWVSKVDLLKVK